VNAVIFLQCVIRDNCKYGLPSNNTNMTHAALNWTEVVPEKIPLAHSVNGSCFVPFQEFCKLTWTTIAIWVS
jgi:hypothetical protein